MSVSERITLSRPTQRSAFVFIGPSNAASQADTSGTFAACFAPSYCQSHHRLAIYRNSARMRSRTAWYRGSSSFDRKDSYLVEFLDLPTDHSEADLHDGLVAKLKDFLIELGGDFCFAGSHYPVQVGGRDFETCSFSTVASVLTSGLMRPILRPNCSASVDRLLTPSHQCEWESDYRVGREAPGTRGGRATRPASRIWRRGWTPRRKRGERGTQGLSYLVVSKDEV